MIKRMFLRVISRAAEAIADAVDDDGKIDGHEAVNILFIILGELRQK